MNCSLMLYITRGKLLLWKRQQMQILPRTINASSVFQALLRKLCGVFPQVQQKLLDVEKKQEKIENRIDCAVKLHSSLEMRLQNLRSVAGLQKKSLSKAERDFKLDMFTEVELDALCSSIESLNARLTRHLHYEQVDSSNRQKQMAGRRVSRIQDNVLSQLKSSLENSLINSENGKKVKLVESVLSSREISKTVYLRN